MTKRTVVAVDIDGVVYDFMASARMTLLETLTPELVGPGKGIWSQPTPTDFDWKAWEIDYKVWNPAIEANAYRIFSTGGALPRSLDALKILDQMDCEYFFCTRPWGNEGSEAWEQAIAGRKAWLESNGLDNIHVEYVKTKDPNELKYTTLIDDHGSHIDEAIEGGASALRVLSPSTMSEKSKSFAPAFPDLYQAVCSLQYGLVASV